MGSRVGLVVVCLLFLLIWEVSAIAETEVGDVRLAREAPHGKLEVAGKRVSVYTVAWSTLAMAAATGLGALPFFFLELEAQWAGLCKVIVYSEDRLLFSTGLRGSCLPAHALECNAGSNNTYGGGC